MKKKIFLSSMILWAFWIGAYSYFWAEQSVMAVSSENIPELECKYNSKFQQCVQANIAGNPRSIDDFPCLATQDYEAILDQIILDESFKDIQKRGEAFLLGLENDVEAVGDNPLQVMDDIMSHFWPEGSDFKEYKKICNGGILAERATCTGGVPIVPAGNRIANWGWEGECMKLANIHLNMSSMTAFDLAKINKSQLVSDAHKKYFQQEREKYSHILSTMQQIVGHTERINPTHYTTNPLQ
jgi:hypothetical protein